MYQPTYKGSSYNRNAPLSKPIPFYIAHLCIQGYKHRTACMDWITAVIAFQWKVLIPPHMYSKVNSQRVTNTTNYRDMLILNIKRTKSNLNNFHVIYHESFETWGFILPLPLLWPIALYSNFDWFDFICIFL